MTASRDPAAWSLKSWKCLMTSVILEFFSLWIQNISAVIMGQQLCSYWAARLSTGLRSAETGWVSLETPINSRSQRTL